MARITELPASKKIVGSTFYVGGMIYTHHHCLQVYGKYCDDFDVEPDKDIHLKTAEEIFTECHRLHNDNT